MKIVLDNANVIVLALTFINVLKAVEKIEKKPVYLANRIKKVNGNDNCQFAFKTDPNWEDIETQG